MKLASIFISRLENFENILILMLADYSDIRQERHCFIQRSRNDLSGLSDFAGRASGSNAPKEIARHSQPVHSPRKLLATVIRQVSESRKFVGREVRKIIQIVSGFVGVKLGKGSYVAKSYHFPMDLTNRSDCKCNAISNPCSNESCGVSFALTLLALCISRNCQSDDDSRARAYSCRNIPEIFRGSRRSRDERPRPKDCQKADCDQQRDKRQLCNFPRALHASPVLDFWGIVARCWALLRIRFPRVGEGPFLHGDAFLHPRRINVISRFV